MTLDQLRVFCEVAELQHVTKAAQKLGMTQSAVSAAIAALEERHAVALFDRVGRSIILNQAGQLFLAEAQKVLAAAASAEASLSDLSGLMKGRLSIKASRTIGAYWLPRRLAAFQQRYPGIKLELSIGNTQDVADAVSTGDVELGLIEWPEKQKGIAAREIAEDEMIVVVPPDHCWMQGSRSNPDLDQSLWILREQGSGTRQAFSSYLEAHGCDEAALEIALTLPSNEAIVGAVEAGLGATLISRSAVIHELEAGRLVEAPFPSLRRPYFLLHHEQRYFSKAAEAFEALLIGGGG